jgi:hypothetical protein
LLNISENVSIDYFSGYIFPLYKQLSKDPEEEVRKTCTDVVPSIARVCPLEKLGPEL